VTADPAKPARRALFLLAGRFPHQSDADALDAALRYGLAAEAHGYAGAWIAEHHFIPYGVCPSAVAFAGHLLGRTQRLRVGTAAAILSNRHPVALAEEAALLDALSGGRLQLGVARGGPWVDLEVFNTGIGRYQNGFAESVDLLRDWLSGRTPIGWTGTEFSFRPVDVVPRPTRNIPLWIAATSGATADLAAVRGLPLLLGMHATDAEKVAMLRRYARVAEEHDHDPATVEHASAHLAYVADADREAADAIRKPLLDLLSGTTKYVRIDGSAPPPRDLDAYVSKLLAIHPVGSPRTCRERLDESAGATGVRHQLLMVEGAGDVARTLDNIARLASDVVS
jgi:alkanesulfonate monooxygenase SsuD/methylene tetrahydromethanopterin reductase-like flavin-dependent oxidoreductase (luciferase family)